MSEGIEMVLQKALQLSEFASVFSCSKLEQTRIITAPAAGLSVSIMANFSTRFRKIQKHFGGRSWAVTAAGVGVGTRESGGSKSAVFSTSTH
jgi:hypothetical protein